MFFNTFLGIKLRRFAAQIIIIFAFIFITIYIVKTKTSIQTNNRTNTEILFEQENFNKILLKKWGAEDGGRLNRKRNLSMLVEIPENEKIKVTNEFIWMSMWQIKECLKFDSWINPHIRGIISHF